MLARQIALTHDDEFAKRVIPGALKTQSNSKMRPISCRNRVRIFSCNAAIR